MARTRCIVADARSATLVRRVAPRLGVAAMQPSGQLAIMRCLMHRKHVFMHRRTVYELQRRSKGCTRAYRLVQATRSLAASVGHDTDQAWKRSRAMCLQRQAG